MSEQQKLLIEVQKKIQVNTANFRAAKVNATMCEVNIKTYQRNMVELDRLHKVKMNNIQKQIDRYIRNLKDMNKTLDTLLEEKEDLYEELKAATHYGQVKCEHCLNYFTHQGLSRHKNTCGSKPEIKKEKEHKAEVKVIKDDIEARKAALKKELAELNKKKPKPVKVVKAKPELEPELEWPGDNGTTATSGEDTEITEK